MLGIGHFLNRTHYIYIVPFIVENSVIIFRLPRGIYFLTLTQGAWFLKQLNSNLWAHRDRFNTFPKIDKAKNKIGGIKKIIMYPNVKYIFRLFSLNLGK